MSRIIDADSHCMEPLDLWERSNALHTLPEVSVNKILGENAVKFFGLSTK